MRIGERLSSSQSSGPKEGTELRKKSIALRQREVLFFIPIILFAAGLSAACGGTEEEEAASPAAQPVETAREISGADLQQMVLRQADLGSAYASFTLDEESGFVSKDQRAEMAFNPADEKRDLDRFGYVNSYAESYSEPTLTEPNASLPAEGPISIDTEVLLFDEADQAGGYLADDLADSKGDVGAAASGGRVESFEEFGVVSIGDEAWGGRLVLVVSDESGEEIRFHFTGIELQRGQMVGFVVILLVDDENVADEVISLARKLDERIKAVLAEEA